MVSQPAALPPTPTPPLAGGGVQHTPSLRKPRRDKGQIRLNSRDLEVLRWIGEQYAVRLDSLQRLLGRQAQHETIDENQITESSARRVVDRWKKEGLVLGRKILAHDPEWVWLTPRGFRHMDLPYKSNEPPAAQLLHRHRVNQIRLHMETKYPQFHWHSERQIRSEHWNEKNFHVPDGEVVVTGDEVLAIEVERTQKSRQRIDEIVKNLARQYEMIWYFVTPESRSAVHLATALYGERFSLHNLEDFVK